MDFIEGFHNRLFKKKILSAVIISLVIFILFLSLIVFFYLNDFKKELLKKLSYSIERKIGHKVFIKDIYFISFKEISMSDLIISNPEYFSKGDLLSAKTISIRIKPKELFKNRIVVDYVRVFEPQLNIVKDEKGNVNVSERLLELFKRKPDKKFQFNKLVIENGKFNLITGDKYEVKDIKLVIDNISSVCGNKVKLNGNFKFLRGIIDFSGWFIIREEPKKFNLSFKTTSLDFSAIKPLSNINLQSSLDEVFIYAEMYKDKDIYLKNDISASSTSFYKKYSFNTDHIKLSSKINLGFVDKSIRVFDCETLIDINGLSLKDKKKIMFDNTNIKGDIFLKSDRLNFKILGNLKKIGFDIFGRLDVINYKKFRLNAKIAIPYIEANDFRESLWNIFPDSLLYTSIQGLMSAKSYITYSPEYLSIIGVVNLKDFIIKGANNEYYIGSMNGSFPLVYSKEHYVKYLDYFKFEREGFLYIDDYDMGKRSYALNIDKIDYGFKIFEKINIVSNFDDNRIKISNLNSNIYDGLVKGSGYLELSSGFNYKIDFSLDGLSLTKLCDEITSIKGYISGRVKGYGMLKGDGLGLSNIKGIANFDAYKTKSENMKISKEFLRKVGGPSIGTYLRDRAFDTGIMNLYIQDGYIIFKDFEISNRNVFGIKDLSIKVAPLSNKISIEHLMWSISEAAKRAKKQ